MEARVWVHGGIPRAAGVLAQFLPLGRGSSTQPLGSPTGLGWHLTALLSAAVPGGS